MTVESPPGPIGCPGCGVLAIGHGRPPVPLVDAPAKGRPVLLLWRKRRWRCPEPACVVVTFLEQDETVAAPRSKLTRRAAWGATEQIRREHASVNGIRRQLGTGRRTVWDTIRPLLEAAEADPARFDDGTVLGVDPHIWHHVSTRPIGSGGRGAKELTGMIDPTRDVHGGTRARLLDLVPGRSGEAYRSWLHDRGPAFRDRVEIATLDPFRGFKNTIDEQLEDARAVLDAFHIVKLGTKVVDDVRRLVQQQMHGHRGRKGDPLYGIRNMLRAGEEHLTDRQRARLKRAWVAESGSASSSATSTPAARTTAVPKPSTASSSSTAASPAASATATTTACACCSSAAGYSHDPRSTAKSPNGATPASVYRAYALGSSSGPVHYPSSIATHINAKRAP